MKQKICSLILLSCLLGLLLQMPFFEAQTAEAKAATLYAPNYWNAYADYGDELEYTSECFDDIYALFVQYGSNYQWIGNFQNFDNPNVYFNNIYYAENNYEEIAVLSKGHIAPQGGGSYSLVVKDTNPMYLGHANDIDISFTTKGNTNFAWIWHCATAMDYPGVVVAYWGPVFFRTSMPFAWTGNVGLNRNSVYHYYCTNFDQVFLGFIYYSPQFRDTTNYGNHDYGEFIVSVFTYMLEDGYSIDDALNAASYDVLGTCYGSSTLHQGQYRGGQNQNMPVKWSYMQIYGNLDTGVL
ncbi:MAG: hypothetical protein FWC33_02890 [Candidatus Bathyarchaeota archaeon]|nr:hypothetical protein [Candidatus Termiticorpusculum sp.]